MLKWWLCLLQVKSQYRKSEYYGIGKFLVFIYQQDIIKSFIKKKEEIVCQ